MREIKFRVWDNVEKAYLNEKDIAIDSLGSIFIIEGYDHNDSELWYARLLPDLDNKRHVIEQYTGLKDKNGRDIYEGDIVKYYPRHNGVPYRVYWANESAKFLIGRKGVVGQELSSVMYNLDTGRILLEVIGNVHENPELLEEEK
jgi:uncharacterized phage protein (TIGR01671 family)